MDSGLGIFILAVHCFLAVCLVIVVLLQRSEGGALGIGSSSSGFMTARGAGNLLTRTTSILATLFVITSIALAGIAAGAGKGSSIVDEALEKQANAPAAPAATLPAAPALPQVPVAE
jgi:preprotein translocase subunit SecG